MNEKQKRFDGYLFSKLSAIGSKSEGPSYWLQQWDYKELAIVKHAKAWQDDPALRKLLGTKVTIIGEYDGGGIVYSEAGELNEPVDPR